MSSCICRGGGGKTLVSWFTAELHQQGGSSGRRVHGTRSEAGRRPSEAGSRAGDHPWQAGRAGAGVRPQAPRECSAHQRSGGSGRGRRRIGLPAKVSGRAEREAGRSGKALQQTVHGNHLSAGYTTHYRCGPVFQDWSAPWLNSFPLSGAR